MIAQRSQKFEAVTGGLRRSKILLLMHPSVERVFGNTIANAANPNSRKGFFVDQRINGLMAYAKNLRQVIDGIAAAFLTGGRRLFLLWKS